MSTKWILSQSKHQTNFALFIAIFYITSTVASAVPQQYDSYQPSKVPDPLQKALDNPHFRPPRDDVADVEETHGPLSQILLAPAQFQQQSQYGKTLKKRSPTYCLKCGGGGGGYGGGGYGGGGGGLGGGGLGGGIIGGFIGGFKKFGGGGGGGGYYPGGGGGGGGYYPGGGGGGGGYYPGGGGGGCGGGCGGGGGGGSYASASASASAKSGYYGK
ncbi:hypothetical protein O3M35_009711 [Rhynocoris fuscipes]|uniref:Uncharacterized protein n=1 Tax=Rhynocoris fuscipes TaxID=488301 RepID=A0AAW1D4Q4_9HEMI